MAQLDQLIPIPRITTKDKLVDVLNTIANYAESGVYYSEDYSERELREKLGRIKKLVNDSEKIK